MYRDLELVESLRYGVPRKVKIYGEECFIFMQNFTRMVLPISKDYLKITGKQVSDQVIKVITAIDSDVLSTEIQVLEYEY